MKFLKQIKIEIKNIVRSKFLLIIGLILVAGSIAPPIISAIASNSSNNGYRGSGDRIYYEDVAIAMESSYSYDNNTESITVDGVTITSDSPYYYNIMNIMDEVDMFTSEGKNIFSNPESIDLAIELKNVQMKQYLRLAEIITTNEDYRADIGWPLIQYVTDVFIYEHNEADESALIDAMEWTMGLDNSTFKQKYIDISSEEKLKALDEIESKINLLYDTIEKNDFPAYVAIRIDQENESIDQALEQIALHEQTIIDNPEQEEYLNEMIEDLEKQIENIKTNSIPIWEYRLENNIIPRDGSWQNSALSQIEQYRSQLSYINEVSEEDFNKDRYMAQEYGTYAKYQATIQKQIDEANEKILVAQNSLDADQPDMRFVRDGARNKTVGFLDYSIFIAIFSILLGGWLIAREFSQGTIRLLMIRPKTRTKILMSKFLAALIICLAIYTAGCLINSVVNGIFSGFSDFGNPNFTASGEVGFFAYYIPKFLASGVPIILAFTAAFMLSTITKNIAVSITVPVVCFIGSYIGINILAYSRMMNWIAYTPLPYIQISSFFAEWSSITTIISRGVPLSLTYGIIMLLVLSVVFTLISIWVFKKRDITN